MEELVGTWVGFFKSANPSGGVALLWVYGWCVSCFVRACD